MSPFFTMVLYSGKALRSNDCYEFKLRPDRWLASRMESQCSALLVSIKDYTIVDLSCSRPCSTGHILQ
jgi:hypothetical protein